jgi:hypothetical protein
VAEGGGLLNRYTASKPYRGFESLRLRQSALSQIDPSLFRVLVARICEFFDCAEEFSAITSAAVDLARGNVGSTFRVLMISLRWSPE